MKLIEMILELVEKVLIDSVDVLFHNWLLKIEVFHQTGASWKKYQFRAPRGVLNSGIQALSRYSFKIPGDSFLMQQFKSSCNTHCWKKSHETSVNTSFTYLQKLTWRPSALTASLSPVPCALDFSRSIEVSNYDDFFPDCFWRTRPSSDDLE